MHPVLLPRRLEPHRAKRRSLVSPSPGGVTAKRVTHEAPHEAPQQLPHGFPGEGNRITHELGRYSPSLATNQSLSQNCGKIFAEERRAHLIASAAACSSPSGKRQEVTAVPAFDLDALQACHSKRMERPPHSHRTPEEVELALEVLNDELAEASPLDRPSLELATQTLTERLVEMRKQQASARNPRSLPGGIKQSTYEYSKSLQAVIVGDGTQKYTLIRIPKQDDMAGDVYLVRGDPKADYHYQTAIETLNALQSRNIMSGGYCSDTLTADHYFCLARSRPATRDPSFVHGKA